MRNRTHPVRAGGFSLLELMIAMVVIAFTLLGVMSMISYTVQVRQVARENQVAAEWVLRRIEEVKSQTFSNLNVGSTYPAPSTNPTQFKGTFSYAAVPTASNNSSGIPSTYYGTPTELPNSAGTLTIDYSNPNLYEIVCTLTWTSVKAAGHQSSGSFAGKSVYTMRSLYAP